MSPAPLERPVDLNNLDAVHAGLHQNYHAEFLSALRTLSDFHFLVGTGSLEHVKAFVDENCRMLPANPINFINGKNPETGMTSLHLAIKVNSLEIVELLMANGADVYQRDDHGLIPAHLALILRHKSILKLILRESVANPVDLRGFTHLHAAALLEDPWYLRKYIEMGGDVNARMVLMAIGRENNRRDVDLELLSLWPVRAKNYWRDTEPVETTRNYQRAFLGYAPLHFAVEHDNVATTELLLQESELDIELRDARGYAAIHLACALSREEPAMKMVKMLLARGADLAARTKSGATAIHVATYMGHKNLVALLLEHGAEANVWEDWDSITPLHLASRYLMVDIVLALIAAGADAKRTDRKKRTPLHWMMSRDWCYGMHSNFTIGKSNLALCQIYLEFCSIKEHALLYLRIEKKNMKIWVNGTSKEE